MYGLITWIVIAIIMGIICYFIAIKKGKNPALWFIFGIIFSVFAVAILILQKEIEKKINAQKLEKK